MFGLIQSPKDSRDWLYSSMKPYVKIPSEFFYPNIPFRDQGHYGTCVGFGSASLKTIQELSDSQLNASPLFIYKECKKIDGLPNSEGTTLKAAMSVLKNTGVCAEEMYPYSLTPATTKVTPVEQASVGKISGYAQLYGVEDIKQALFSDSPVLIGIGVTNKFRNLGKGEHFVTTLFGDQVIGGHCLVIVGFSDTKTANGKTGFFKVKNSWADFGDENGCFWMAYDVVTERSDYGIGYFMEAWSTIDISTGFTGTKIEMQINNQIAYVNGKPVTLDQSPFIVKETGRTVIPARFLAESLGAKVSWDATTQKITIIK